MIGGLHPHRSGLVRSQSLVGHDGQRATVIFVRLSSKARRGRGEPEYRINSNVFVGGAFDYSNPKARLFNNAGTTDVNSYQLGIYGAWAEAHFFAQGLATFGWQNFRNTRPGVVDIIFSAGRRIGVSAMTSRRLSPARVPAPTGPLPLSSADSF